MLLDHIFPFNLQWLCERGAQMGMRSGWEQPNWFAGPGDEPGYRPSFRRTNWFEPVGRECQLVLERVGMIDLSPYGKIEVNGKDASSFLDMVFANELPKVRNNVLGKRTHGSNTGA